MISISKNNREKKTSTVLFILKSSFIICYLWEKFILLFCISLLSIYFTTKKMPRKHSNIHSVKKWCKKKKRSCIGNYLSCNFKIRWNLFRSLLAISQTNKFISCINKWSHMPLFKISTVNISFQIFSTSIF